MAIFDLTLLSGCYRWLLMGNSVPRGYTKDEGRSPGIGMQEQTSNQLNLLWQKATVMIVKEKVWQDRFFLNEAKYSDVVK